MKNMIFWYKSKYLLIRDKMAKEMIWKEVLWEIWLDFFTKYYDGPLKNI
jgi:hypothetical protein